MCRYSFLFYCILFLLPCDSVCEPSSYCLNINALRSAVAPEHIQMKCINMEQCRRKSPDLGALKGGLVARGLVKSPLSALSVNVSQEQLLRLSAGVAMVIAPLQPHELQFLHAEV